MGSVKVTDSRSSSPDLFYCNQLSDESDDNEDTLELDSDSRNISHKQCSRPAKKSDNLFDGKLNENDNDGSALDDIKSNIVPLTHSVNDSTCINSCEPEEQEVNSSSLSNPYFDKTSTERQVEVPIQTATLFFAKKRRAEDWGLKDEDLLGPGVMVDKHKCTFEDFFSSPQWLKKVRKGKRLPRIYQKRTGASSMYHEKSYKRRFVAASSPLMQLMDYAKKMGIDVTELMEDRVEDGLNFKFPCMQCYEKYGQVMADDSYYDTERSPTAAGSDGRQENRCGSCGGQVQTLDSFAKMIGALRKKIKERDFIVKDVYPDGNCLFGSIIDQLRIRGNFRFSVLSLREAAVEYLQRNPNAEDGTPLAMFLTDETWEAYLQRMSEDGQWGDHMVLRAISSILDMKIHIFGGMSGHGETCITPMNFVEEQGEDKEKEVQVESCLYLGHFGESHYISLRHKDWQQRLNAKMQIHLDEWTKQLVGRGDQTHTRMVRNPLLFLDVLLSLTFRLQYLQSFREDMVDMLCMQDYKSDGQCNICCVGSTVCFLNPEFVKIESLFQDIDSFIPQEKEERKELDMQVIILKSPVDSKVVFDEGRKTKFDLVAAFCEKGTCRLIPIRPKMWKDMVSMDADGKMYLKGIPETIDSTKKYPRIVAFQCSWPPNAMEWVTRKRHCPNARTVQTVFQNGCHVVPLMEHHKMNDIIEDYLNDSTEGLDILWGFTFASAEKEICRFLFQEQRSVYLLFKMFVDHILGRDVLRTAVFKSVFFYACEHIEDSKWWSQPGECFMILLRKLAVGFGNGFLPHYFIATKNLLAGVPKELLQACSRKLEVGIRQPVVNLYLLFDANNILSSEIGAVLDDLVAETCNLEKHADIDPSFSKLILPSLSSMIQSFVYQTDYQYAYLVVQIAKDMMVKLNNGTSSTASVVATAFPGHIGYAWCLGLYIDMSQTEAETCVTREICRNHDSVHITEVFGPDCLDFLPNTLVPSQFSVENGDLQFLSDVSAVLEKHGRKVLIVCLKFYLLKYNELASDNLVINYGQSQSHTSEQTHMYLMNNLFYLGIKLFNALFELKREQEFKDFMPKMTILMQYLQYPVYYRNMEYIWSHLGEETKADEVRQMRLQFGNDQDNFM